MAEITEQLATPVVGSYDVVVLGSGYGGSLAASRLARSRHPAGSPVTAYWAMC